MSFDRVQGRDLIAAMEPPNDPPPMMGPMGPMFGGGGANGVDLMVPPPPANVRLERIRGMQGRREEALRGGLEVAGDLAAIGNLIRQASIAKEEDAPRTRHLSIQDSVLSFQPEVAVAAVAAAEASVNGIYVGGKVLSPEANYFEVDILDKGTSSIHLTFSIGVVSRLFSLDSLPGRVNDSFAFCPGDGFLFRGKDVGSPFGSRAEVGDKIGCGLRFSPSQAQSPAAPSPKIAGDYDEYPPINQRVDVGLSDQELVTLSTKELNRMLKKKGISKDRAKEIKRERRTLKNRGYAANCRVKREDEEKTLEQENERLCRLITHHRMYVEKTKKETELMKQRFAKGQEELRLLKEQEEIYGLKMARLRREADQQNQAIHIPPPASILSNLPDIQFQRVEEGNEARKSSEIKLITLP